MRQILFEIILRQILFESLFCAEDLAEVHPQIHPGRISVNVDEYSLIFT